MTWWQSGAQFAQLFADEEVLLGYGWGARVVVLAREGKPLAVEVNQAILDQTFYAISKISKNKEAAMKFIAFASQTKPQAERPVLYPHGPTNRAAWAQLDAKAKRDVVNYDLPECSCATRVVDGQRDAAARAVEEVPCHVGTREDGHAIRIVPALRVVGPALLRCHVRRTPGGDRLRRRAGARDGVARRASLRQLQRMPAAADVRHQGGDPDASRTIRHRRACPSLLPSAAAGR
jgi:hypothetical protein